LRLIWRESKVGEIPNSKHQTNSKFQAPNSKQIQNSKFKTLTGIEAGRRGSGESLLHRSPEESNICSNKGGKRFKPLPSMVFPDAKMSHREGFGERLAVQAAPLPNTHHRMYYAPNVVKKKIQVEPRLEMGGREAGKWGTK
jgi:hypothetical protein